MITSGPDRGHTSGVPSVDALPPRDVEADEALHAVIEATRALLWIETRADAAAAASDLVEALGGTTVPAGTSTSEAIPVDLSFGQAEPMLPTAAPSTVARMLLERHLPAFVRDANRALELGESTERLAEQAAIDPLTGLASRRMLGRVTGRLRPDHTVIMIDLDHFKDVNDTLGHHEGDRVLRALGRAITASLRATDTAGRYGGEEFVVIIDGEGAEPFLDRLQDEWVRIRPHTVTFSAGVAPASPNTARALEAADRAMYRAKRSGRDRWCAASADDYL